MRAQLTAPAQQRICICARAHTIFSRGKQSLRAVIKRPAGRRVSPAKEHGHISPAVGQLFSGDAGCCSPAVRQADGVRVADGGEGVEDVGQTVVFGVVQVDASIAGAAGADAVVKAQAHESPHVGPSAT